METFDMALQDTPPRNAPDDLMDMMQNDIDDDRPVNSVTSSKVRAVANSLLQSVASNPYMEERAENDVADMIPDLPFVVVADAPESAQSATVPEPTPNEVSNEPSVAEGAVTKGDLEVLSQDFKKPVQKVLSGRVE